MNKYLVSLSAILFAFSINSISANDSKGNSSIDLTKQDNNWFNLDSAINKVYGISTEKTYEQLLKGKPSKTVIVAVIDGGVDINHEDLQGKIWTNEKEIPGNNIDDDNNGYTDDIHGWNYLGNNKGENINYETLEVTRLYKKHKTEIEALENGYEITDKHKVYLNSIKEKYLEKRAEAEANYTGFMKFDTLYSFADSIIRSYLHMDTYTIKNLKGMYTGYNKQLDYAKKFMMKMYKRGFSKDEYIEYKDYVVGQYLYRTNPDFSARSILNDNIDDINDVNYGNNDVKGPNSFHGTFVAGMIAANRNNNIGIKGIVDNVQIMSLRVVPDGDENDKDIARAIRYAADNGARVINMSFGKDFSPHKEWVDSAIAYAERKGVLMVNAAGNEGENIDYCIFYPNNIDTNGNIYAREWITVGATAYKAGKKMVADFSNYGKKNVDIFAPGVDIYSSLPENKYGSKSGTSMASPVVTGVAALLWSYYPNLKSDDIRQIILESGSKPSKLKVYQPNLKSKKKILFSELSVTGSVVNAYNALKFAEQYAQKE